MAVKRCQMFRRVGMAGAVPVAAGDGANPRLSYGRRRQKGPGRAAIAGQLRLAPPPGVEYTNYTSPEPRNLSQGEDPVSDPATPPANRRDFLKASAATAAAVSLAGVPLVHAQGNDVIKVGLIGCGGRGSGAARNILQTGPNI